MAIEFTTKNCETELFEIELFNNSVVEKWLACLKSDQRGFQGDISKYTLSLGSLFTNLESVHRDLRGISNELHESGLKQFPKELVDFSLPSLASLHQLKENIFPFVSSGYQSKKINAAETTNRLLELNNLIHQAEALQPNSNSNRICFLSPRKSRLEIDQQDIPFFGTDCRFGYLYLDYFTNGRTPLDVFISKNPYKPVSQKNFGSRFWISLEEDFIFDQHDEIYRWLKQNKFFGQDPDVFPLSEAPLGRIINYRDSQQLIKRAANCLSFSKILVS